MANFLLIFGKLYFLLQVLFFSFIYILLSIMQEMYFMELKSFQRFFLTDIWFSSDKFM